ncbi:FAD/NAD(P)-binding domain-containing protein [Myriangium duriaei CBS 260.36]|uniref:FAD/NAD(P)-binding domain-containing protein n=1 Tax=Myriangium duriaei CBS 260.36 TaxID=1168546 RepID=A0A9P4J8K1_9PEZI|nr:FAD/NAD(P)-binding domain-containing protein [Myriangium duriaei CBS 260.36]
MAISSIIIVGAGPAGLLLGALLARAGIPSIKILERDPQPSGDTRAVFYQPIALHEFKRACIMQAVDNAAFRPRKAVFRNMSGEALFEMPGTSMIALTSDKLASIVQEEFQTHANADIKWSHEVTALGEDEAKRTAWVDVQTPHGTQRLTADYVVGCDGGSSTIRKLLFGPNSMAGFTWEKQLMAANVCVSKAIATVGSVLTQGVQIKYDFPSMPDIADSNLYMDPERSWLLLRTGKEEHHWRVVYAADPNTTYDNLVAECPNTMQELLPGHPKREEYEISSIQPYKIHQRIVENMRKGRFILASDAAHLCCPYGAMGLNGGIADVGSLSDCLQAFHEGKTDDSIFDVYSTVRRDKWKTIIDPQSQGMLRFLFSQPANVIPNHPVYKFSQAMAANPDAAQKLAPNPLALAYDFTPHFKTGHN